MRKLPILILLSVAVSACGEKNVEGDQCVLDDGVSCAQAIEQLRERLDVVEGDECKLDDGASCSATIAALRSELDSLLERVRVVEGRECTLGSGESCVSAIESILERVGELESTIESTIGARWVVRVSNTCFLCPHHQDQVEISCRNRFGEMLDESLCPGEKPRSLYRSYSYYITAYGRCGAAGMDVIVERRVAPDGLSFEYRVQYNFFSDYDWQIDQGQYLETPWSTQQIDLDWQRGRDHPFLSIIPGDRFGPATFVRGGCKGGDLVTDGYATWLIFQ